MDIPKIPNNTAAPDDVPIPRMTDVSRRESVLPPMAADGTHDINATRAHIAELHAKKERSEEDLVA